MLRQPFGKGWAVALETVVGKSFYSWNFYPLSVFPSQPNSLMYMYSIYDNSFFCRLFIQDEIKNKGHLLWLAMQTFNRNLSTAQTPNACLIGSPPRPRVPSSPPSVPLCCVCLVIPLFFRTLLLCMFYMHTKVQSFFLITLLSSVPNILSVRDIVSPDESEHLSLLSFSDAKLWPQYD